ncbi:hypothetical protein M0811_03655 [Anaeramoeba ignava]|uniref:Uncharacterized protein n=1 Tax=Anaeramoeba ignava TaxID=1746090 RepID=A0A9Q0RHE8_ANAIG|nr:hypothetical protein M0811_03655 [Anaeramoeba ignava]
MIQKKSNQIYINFDYENLIAKTKKIIIIKEKGNQIDKYSSFHLCIKPKKNSPITLYLFSQFKNNTIKKIYISVDKIDIKTESLNRNTKKID